MRNCASLGFESTAISAKALASSHSPRSGQQRFYERAIGFRFPLLFSGVAEVCEWYDDSIKRFRIEVAITNRVWGRLFGYCGSFEVEWV